MRNESEKKSIVKSVKMTKLQDYTIKMKAEKRNMSFSSYMVHSAYHYQDNELKPQIIVKIQEICNMATALAEACARYNFVEEKHVNILNEEVKALWEYLK